MANASKVSGAQLVCQTWTGAASQKWRAERNAKGLYTLVNQNSGLPFGAANVSFGANVCQKTAVSVSFSVEDAKIDNAYMAAVDDSNTAADSPQFSEYLFNQQNRANAETIAAEVDYSNYPRVADMQSNLEQGNLFFLSTHGTIFSLNLYQSACGEAAVAYDISGLSARYGDNYYAFANTRCAVLLSCSTAEGGSINPGNVVNTLHQYGVRTVVGFQSIQYYPQLSEWAHYFLQYTASGYTVAAAANASYRSVISDYETIWNRDYLPWYVQEQKLESETTAAKNSFMRNANLLQDYYIAGSGVQKLVNE